jgi:hypothetical protein
MFRTFSKFDKNAYKILMAISNRERVTSEPEIWVNKIKVDPMESDCESKHKTVLA